MADNRNVKKVGLIGGGNMASAIIAGVLRSQLLKPEEIRCSDPDEARRQQLQERFGITTAVDNHALAGWAEMVVIAVKPQVVAGVLSTCADALDANTCVLSVCAGVPLAKFQQALPDGVRLIRSMPNTPALAGAGATAIARGPNATDQDMAFARALFESVGTCVEVEERYLDAVTGLSGSGPAYVMMIIEGLADGGVRAGLPRAVAQELALQTVYGAAALVKQTQQHPAVLKDQVTSPGGTTIEGVFALEQAGVRQALIDAVCKATERSKQLGKDA